MTSKKTLFNKELCLSNHDPLFLHCLREELSKVRKIIDQMYNEVYEYIADPHFENLMSPSGMVEIPRLQAKGKFV
jgi:hypothetical protein